MSVPAAGSSDVWSVVRSPVLLATSGTILTLGGLIGLFRAYLRYSRRLKLIRRARRITSMEEAEAAAGSASLIKANLTGVLVKMEGHVDCRFPLASPGPLVYAAMISTKYKGRSAPVETQVPWSCALDGGSVSVRDDRSRDLCGTDGGGCVG